ncbi:Cuticle protein 10.9, partial [Stegodyphus mimosarum]
MLKVFIIVVLAFGADCQRIVIPPANYENRVITPYQFSYIAPAIGGVSSHQQTGDGAGRVTGSYSIQQEDGLARIVDYVADEYGFRASIVTNEPGTSNQSPADVTFSSSAENTFPGTSLTIQRGPPIELGVIPGRFPARGTSFR